MHDAALQFVRKISGTTRPSQTNEAAFYDAVEEIEKSVRKLLQAMDTKAPPKNREVVAAKARARAQQRYAHAD
jgi:hypothetical protein